MPNTDKMKQIFWILVAIIQCLGVQSQNVTTEIDHFSNGVLFVPKGKMISTNTRVIVPINYDPIFLEKAYINYINQIEGLIIKGKENNKFEENSNYIIDMLSIKEGIEFNLKLILEFF